MDAKRTSGSRPAARFAPGRRPSPSLRRLPRIPSPSPQSPTPRPARALRSRRQATPPSTGSGPRTWTEQKDAKIRKDQKRSSFVPFATFCSKIQNHELAAHADAPRRKITPARVATLAGAVQAFEAVVDSPRGVIVNRSTLRRELKTDVAALMELLPDLDDLVLQFDETDVARRFQSAWKQARIIVDAGHGPGEDEAPEPPATT